AAAAVVADAELGVERVIRVAGAVLVLDFGVVATPLVFVLEEQADGGAVGDAVEDAGPEFGRVRLVPLGGEGRLAGPAAAEVGEEIVDGEGQPGPAAVGDASRTRAGADARRCAPK